MKKVEDWNPQVLLLSGLFLSFQFTFCFKYFKALLLGACVIITGVSSWWTDPSIILKRPYLTLVTSVFQSVLSDICMATPALVGAMCML